MSLFSRLSYISRLRKLELFNRTFSPTAQMRVLDIGAQTNAGGNEGLQFTDWYAWKNNLTAVNLSPQHIWQIRRRYPQVNAVIADARELPWPDKYFDIVHSNAVIEHVGDFENQRKMASEIMRVGKQWFVATPNRWYPFEFHTRLPFVTWFGGNTYLSAKRIIGYDHSRKKYTLGNKKAGFRLMTARELKSCFQHSTIIKQRVTFMAETLIAAGKHI